MTRLPLAITWLRRSGMSYPNEGSPSLGKTQLDTNRIGNHPPNGCSRNRMKRSTGTPNSQRRGRRMVRSSCLHTKTRITITTFGSRNATTMVRLRISSHLWQHPMLKQGLCFLPTGIGSPTNRTKRGGPKSTFNRFRLRVVRAGHRYQLTVALNQSGHGIVRSFGCTTATEIE